MVLTREERETIILFNEGEDTATVFTYRKAWIRYFNTLVEPDFENIEGGCQYTLRKADIRMPRRSMPRRKKGTNGIPAAAS